MITLLWLLACSAEPTPTENSPNWRARVQFAPAEAADAVPVATLPARIEAAAGSATQLSPPAQARLVSWSVKPGDTVQPGDPLAVLRSPELVALHAEMSEARTALAGAEQALALAEQALERGVGARAERNLAEAARNDAAARLRRAERQLAASRDTTRGDGADQTWLSPAGGLVAELMCERGTVTPDDVCLRLEQPELATVRVGIPERLVGAVDLRVSATARFGAIEAAGLSAVALSPSIDPHDRTQHLWLTAPSAPMGSRGLARLSMPAEGVVRLPASALTSAGGGFQVFIDGAEGPEAREVELVGRDEDLRFVTGVNPGESVAIEGVFLLKSLLALGEV